MSGIFGIVHFDDGRASDRDLARLAFASRHRAVDGYAIWVDRSVAIGHQHSRVTPESATEQQPLVSSAAVISFDGRLDNRDDLARSCATVLHGDVRTLSDAELIAAAYRVFGAECAGRMIGDFAFALFDRVERRLVLARDLMGARPLYYAQCRGGIVFASDMKALLAHPDVAARPDEDALADLVLNGYFDGERTWLDGVSSVPPGCVVAASSERVVVRRVADVDDREIRYNSPAEYSEHFRVLFTQAVSRRLRSAHPVAVSVSGGLDSSSIYCMAARSGGATARGFTLAFPRHSAADEHAYVEELRASGLDVEDIAVDDVRLVTHVEHGVARTEMPRLPWECQDALLARARDAGCRVLLDGFCGDQVLAGRAYLVDLARAGRWRAVGQHLRALPDWMPDVSPRLLHKQLAGEAARRVAPSWLMRAARHTIGRARAARRYPAWFTPNFRERARQRGLDRARTRRRFRTAHQEQCWGSATSGHYLATVLQTNNTASAFGIDVAYPYRDRDLVAFLAAIPGDVISEAGVPKALLRHAVHGVLPDAIRLRRTKADGTALSNRATQLAGAVARQSLGPECLAARAGFLDPRTLRTHLPDVFNGGLDRDDDANVGWRVADTLALELWVGHFCGGADAADN